MGVSPHVCLHLLLQRLVELDEHIQQAVEALDADDDFVEVARGRAPRQ